MELGELCAVLGTLGANVRESKTVFLKFMVEDPILQGLGKLRQCRCHLHLVTESVLHLLPGMMLLYGSHYRIMRSAYGGESRGAITSKT
jgi:hypothetical protein